MRGVWWGMMRVRVLGLFWLMSMWSLWRRRPKNEVHDGAILRIEKWLCLVSLRRIQAFQFRHTSTDDYCFISPVKVSNAYLYKKSVCLACLSCSKMYVTDQIWLWQVRPLVLPYNTSGKLPLTAFALLSYRASLICDKIFTDKFKTCPTVLILKWYESREDTFPRRTFSFHPKCQHATLYSLFNHSCLELKERMILLSDHVDKNGSSAENASTYTTLS